MSKFRKPVLLALVILAGCAGRQTAPTQFSAVPIMRDALVQTGTDDIHTIALLEQHALRAISIPGSSANEKTALDLGVKLPQLPHDVLDQWPMLVVLPDHSSNYTMLIATPDPNKEYTMLQVMPRIDEPVVRTAPDMLLLRAW